MILREENITGNVLKHMIHSEDLILTGREGCLLLLRTFRDIFNALKGNSPTSRITQKIDGAPAVIAASDFHGQKFVALKHSWDKGKIFQSVEEIKDNFSDRPDLCAKLEYLFNSLDSIQIPKDEIWHGDFLYHIDDIKIDEIDNKKYIVFRPNTIVYAIPIDDPLSETIMKSTIGVAWHTKYTGKSFDDIHISFDVSVSSVNEVPDVYQMDAKIPSLVGRVTMTPEETERAEETLDSLDLMVNGITVDEGYNELVSNEIIVLLLNTYRNYIIKESNRQFPDIQGLKEWIIARGEKEKEKKKTDKGKASVEAKTQGLISVIDKNNDLILRIYEAQKFATTLKEMFISKLNSLSSMKSFVSHISQGYIATSGEGFAVSDVDGNVYKLVSRLEFSRNNFSKEIIKGWQSEKRMNERRLPKKSALKLFKEELESEDAQEENQSIEDAKKSNNVKVDLEDAKEIFDKEVNDKINAEFKPNAGWNGGFKNKQAKNEFQALLMPKEKGVEREDIYDLALSTLSYVDDRGHDGKTPLAKASLIDESTGLPFLVDIIFKDNQSKGMDATKTKNMEEFYGKCVCQAFFERSSQYSPSDDVPSFNELLEEDITDKYGLPASWKNTFRNGTIRLVDEYSDGGKNIFYVFREDSCISPPGYESKSESIHTMIDDVIKRRNIFPADMKSKDSWNPSDIYLCRVDSYDEFKREWNSKLESLSKGDTPEDLKMNRYQINDLLREFMRDHRVIGVSLKKMGPKNLNFHEMNLDNHWEYEKYSIKYNKVKIPTLELFSERDKPGIGIYFTGISPEGKEIKYQFRRFNGIKGYSMQLDATPSKGGAHDGKASINVVRGDYADTMKDTEFNQRFPEGGDQTTCINKILELRPMVEYLLNKNHLDIETSDGIPFTLERWDGFVEKLKVLNSTGIDYEDKHWLNDWPKIISFLCILEGNSNNTTEDLISKWAASATKYGEYFAPFAKIS